MEAEEAELEKLAQTQAASEVKTKPDIEEVGRQSSEDIKILESMYQNPRSVPV